MVASSFLLPFMEWARRLRFPTLFKLTALLFAGAALRVLAGIVGAGASAVLALTLLVPYRRRRVELMIDPWNDGMNGLGDGYQLAQSYKTIAEGGLAGLGLGNSHQTFGYLPECHTDFIFAIVAGELGMPGAMFVTLLFLCLLYLGLHLARQAANSFGSIAASALTVMIVFQAYLNMACVIGVFPLTGKPLPMISYGGSSMISTMLLLGIVLSCWREPRVSESEYRKRRENLRVVKADRAAHLLQERQSQGPQVPALLLRQGRDDRTHRDWRDQAHEKLADRIAEVAAETCARAWPSKHAAALVPSPRPTG